MLLQRLAPAKVNLMLHVVGRLANGYHHLQTLMTFVDCGDLLSLKRVSSQDSLTIGGEFALPLQGESSNSVIQAKNWFYRFFNCSEPFFDMELQKNIPVAAGLGGGSSDTAALIALLLEWHQFDLSLPEKQQLIVTSGELGADVPVCLAFQLGLGSYFWLDGTGVTELPQALDVREKLDIILINPRIAVSTAAIFQALNSCFSRSLASPLLNTKADIFNFLSNTQNDLQEPARQAHLDIPEIAKKIKALTMEEIIVRQSGSGATYIVVVDNAIKAQQLVTQINKTYPEWWVKLSQSLPYFPSS